MEEIKTVEETIRTLNREMGEVQGELRIIKWLMGGTFFVVLGQWVTGIIL